MKHRETQPFSTHSYQQQYSRQTIQKALAWLKNQQQELAEHITDINLVVKLYLKNKERIPTCNSFTKELIALNPEKQTKSKSIDKPSLSSLSLDINSQEAIEKARAQLNIPSKEALKVLIQLGAKALQTLFKSH